eukprot:CAMPEP_0206141376 /NCGR_PEP_ID=MMETSP1473-20131121/12694_1 /ASSEMBLY_ACC=CAM_ASM_001109 /TAXON_ID=1461547 /ORGANISM="Stichococcus sp, Strain RCC1054" /LENGTH=381 /DNA_ID=CAMNT_0053535919 /DNA_START=132 /DNA_END=1274 /DNA_ORIENTATION=+
MASAYSNPAPPSERPKARVPETPLRNSDFRALLDTPRAERLAEYTPKGGDGEQKEKKPKKPYRPKPEAPKEEVDEGPQYRDRAEERRKGVNPDYDGFNTEINTINGQTQAVEAALTIDETKFLGGDVEHTHLVKGLDYALLAKVREEDQEKETEEALAARARAKAMRSKEFKTPLGSQVYTAIFQPPKRNVAERFLPRRTAFAYDLDDDADGGLDIPTTLYRSKADCPKPVESMLGVMDGAVLERLAKIMGYMKTAAGTKGKKLKKREKLRMLAGDSALATPSGSGLVVQDGRPHTNGSAGVPAATTAAAPADDDDIFGGVGAEYELPDKRAGDKSAGKKDGTYFDKPDEMKDLPALPQAPAGGEAVPPPPPELPPPPPPP